MCDSGSKQSYNQCCLVPCTNLESGRHCAEAITESFVIRHAGKALKGQCNMHSVIASNVLSLQMPSDMLHIAGKFASVVQSESN